MRALLKRFWEWSVSKSGRPLAVLFLRGDDRQSVAIADEIGRSRAGIDRVIVSWRELDEQRFREVHEFIALDSRRPWRSMMGLRLKLLRRRVSSIVIHLTSEAPPAQRWTAVGAWREVQIYNDDAERYRVDWRHSIATWRFLRGEPLEDIHRPTGLGFLRQGLAWVRVVVTLCGGWLRRRASAVGGPKVEAGREGCSVLCVPGAAAEEIDRHVAKCDSAEVVATRELAFPDAATIAALRQRLQQSGVWLVCARADFRYVLDEGWAPHRPQESGTFCLGARSSLVGFRRDVFLELGGLAAFEQQMPGQGWAALSLRALLRGYKAVYAGDIDARTLTPPPVAPQPIEGPPLASMLAVCDHAPTAARLLRRHARTAEFRVAYREALSRLRLPAARGRRNGKLIPLVEPGSAILPGRETGRAFRLAVLTPQIPDAAAENGMSRVHHLLRRLAEHCDVFLFCFASSARESQIEPLLETCAQLVLVRPELEANAAPDRLAAGRSRPAALVMRRHMEVLIEDWRIPLAQVEGADLTIEGPWLARNSALAIAAVPELRFALRARARSSALLGASRPAWIESGPERRRELRRLRQFDCVVTASARDRELLEKKLTRTQVRVVENGVALGHFRSAASAGDPEHVLWVAEFAQPLSMAAFDVLTREIWPRVRAARPSAKLTVVAGEDFRLHWRRRFRRGLPEAPPDVTVLGHVGDLRPLYERAGAVLALLPAGGAASLPVLEALAMSRAVVSTLQACQGLGVEAGRDLMVAEQPAEFADAIVKVLSDEALRRSLGRQGRLRVEAGFDWGRSAAQQLKIYEEMLRERGRAR